MTRAETINLLIKMIELNQREQAKESFLLAHSAFPEWQLNIAPELKAMKEAQ